MSQGQMSTVEKVKSASGLPQAMLAIAEVLDRIEAKLPVALDPDPWMEWAGPPGEPGWSPPAEAFPALNHEAELRRQQAIAAVQQQLADTHDPEDVRALQAKLRLLQDTHANITNVGVLPEGTRPEIAGDGTVDFTAVSAERKQARAEWARTHELWEFIKLDKERAIDAFSKGGPMWLYIGNRQAIMEMPIHYRQWLVSEVQQDSPADAIQMGRDILKSADSTDQAITVAAIENGVASGR